MKHVFKWRSGMLGKGIIQKCGKRLSGGKYLKTILFGALLRHMADYNCHSSVFSSHSFGWQADKVVRIYSTCLG